MENTYNAEGKRVAKAVDGGQSVRYFYEYNNVVFEYVNGGAVTVFNVIGTNLISREIGSDKVYYFYNGHGDVTALLDATTKNIRSQYQYDSFGNITLEKYYDSNGVLTADPDEMIKSQIRYAGYQYDEESDYYNLHARYYDPKTARFLQQDTYTGTIGDPLSLNLYAYCHNEPMMYFDPTGHWEEIELHKDMNANQLLNAILQAKDMWEENQKIIDEAKKTGFFGGIYNFINKKKINDIIAEAKENQQDATVIASEARDMIKQTEAYKTNKHFKDNYEEYYASKYGGTRRQVNDLLDVLARAVVINPDNFKEPSKGTGKTDRMSTLEDVKYEKGYNSFTYMANGTNVNVNIYITDTSTEYVTFSLGKKGVEKLENMTIEGKKVVAKTNAGYFSGSVESLGIFAVDGKWLSEGQNGYDYENYPTLMAKTVNGKQQVTATKYQGQVSKKDKIIALAAQNDWVIAGSTMLVYDGKIAETGGNRITSESRNPRTIIGYRKDGSFVIVAVDGPIVSGKRTGLTTKESAQLMEEFDVQYALNLDGGPSTQMYVGNELVSDTILEKNGLRSIGSALFVVKK